MYDQLRQLAAALITGGAVGLAFDLIKWLPGNKAAAKSLRRILCTAVSAVLVFAVGRASGAGLRLFYLLAVAGGICLYHGALHTMVCGDMKTAKQFLQYYAQSVERSAVSDNEQTQKHAKTKRKRLHFENNCIK